MKKADLFFKGTVDRSDRGVSSPARAKASAPAQQFGGVATRLDRSAKNVSKKAKRAAIHEYKGPRRRPIE